MEVNLQVSKLIFKTPGENGISRGLSINSTGAEAPVASHNSRSRI